MPASLEPSTATADIAAALAPTATISNRSIAIAAFSTIVEWYDFTLYLYLSTVLSRVFFGGGAAALATTLGGFAIAYLMRPLGAAVLGHFGDRTGRRRMMLLSMALMAAAMAATALLPTYASVGPIAGVLLLVWRCFMAFSVGAEYTGVVAYLVEGAPQHRRGLVASLAAAASEVGGLLAAGISAITVLALDTQSLEAWGWRIPFFIGAALAAGVCLARSHMEESPAFERMEAAAGIWGAPLKRVWTQQRAGVIRGFAISALGSVTYYVGITYVPAFLVASRVMPEGDALGLATLAAIAVILVTPLVGHLADRIGRKPVLLVLCATAALLPVPLFVLMSLGPPAQALVGAVLLAAIGGGVSAVGAVATAEQLPIEGRMSGLALGATTATAIFGGLTPYLGQVLLEWLGSPLVPGAIIALVAAAFLPVLARMPETRPKDNVAP